jgi:hypothetical protein
MSAKDGTGIDGAVAALVGHVIDNGVEPQGERGHGVALAVRPAGAAGGRCCA